MPYGERTGKASLAVWRDHQAIAIDIRDARE